MRLDTAVAIIFLALLVPTSGVIYGSWVSSQAMAERASEHAQKRQEVQAEHARQCRLAFPRNEVQQRGCVEGTL